MNFKIFLMVIIGLCHTYLSYGQNYPRKEIDLDLFVQDLFGQQDNDVDYGDIYESVFQYYRSPLDLNLASREDLENLYILSPLQIKNLIEYIAKNGKLLSIYELQAIREFDKTLIDKLIPFVKVQDDGLTSDNRSLWERIRTEENNYAIFRFQRLLEDQKGFKKGENGVPFVGDPNKYYARYRVQQKNDFSIGITTEKDIGEQISWNPSLHQYGMDYYSAHFALFNKGILKSLVIGDYQVQIGQGLVMAAGFFIGKGSQTVNTVKRSNQGLRPYSGAMEWGYLRGAAATLNFGRFDNTTFASVRQLDANRYSAPDSNLTEEEQQNSLYLTGLHRTSKELRGKDLLGEYIAGNYFTYTSKDKNLKVGLNSVLTLYNGYILKRPSVYNQHDFRGSYNYNLG